jgi:hypothetical protein
MSMMQKGVKSYLIDALCNFAYPIAPDVDVFITYLLLQKNINDVETILHIAINSAADKVNEDRDVALHTDVNYFS